MASDQEILDYIKTQQEVSIPALQKKFSADYFGISKLIRKLVAEGTIRLDSGIRYTVIQKGREDDAADEDDDDEFDDEDDIMKQRRAYLEARRQEIMRKMREDIETDDDDDDEAEAESQDDFDDDDRTPPEVDAMVRGFKDGISITEYNGAYYIVPDWLEIGGNEVSFKVLLLDDGVYLSDDRFALLTLDARLMTDDREIYEYIVSIAAQYHIEIVEAELRIKVDSPEDVLSCILYLFAAMERIVMIDEGAVAACIEYDKEDHRIWDAAKELLIADPDMDRGELILRMRERYQSVKDGENIDDIIIYARAVKEFARMSDEDYEESRDFLLGIEKKQDDAETDSEEKEGRVLMTADEAEASITNKTAASNASNKGLEECPDSPLYIKALAIVIQEGEASISLVQRKCDITYTHAGKIIEWMESMGYITPFDGKKARQVLITKEEFIKKYGPLD